MKGGDMRRLSLKSSDAGCGSVPVIAVTCDMIDIARRLLEKNMTAHENRPS
jgi:hypothetical protein